MATSSGPYPKTHAFLEALAHLISFAQENPADAEGTMQRADDVMRLRREAAEEYPEKWAKDHPDSIWLYVEHQTNVWHTNSAIAKANGRWQDYPRWRPLQQVQAHLLDFLSRQ